MATNKNKTITTTCMNRLFVDSVIISTFEHELIFAFYNV